MDVGNILDNAISTLLDFLSDLFNTLFFWLPDDPFSSWINDFAVSSELLGNYDWLGWLNWFLPISSLLSIFEIILACLMVWVAYKIFSSLLHLILELIPG